MKTFYTERDIEDLHAAGVTTIEVDDDVVLTDLAREKASVLGLRLEPVANRKPQTDRILRNLAGSHLPASAAEPAQDGTASSAASAPKTVSESVDTGLVEQVKAGVIAKLGTTEYNGVLDQVIPQVLARLNVQQKTGQAANSASSSSSNDY